MTVPVGAAAPARHCGSCRRPSGRWRAACAPPAPGRRSTRSARRCQETVELAGHSVCVELHGHGIGRRIHEPPDVPNYADERADRPLTDGLVITIEPIIAAGAGAVVGAEDGWTVRTVDRSLSAHVEHTIVVAHGAPVVLTALAA